MALRIGMGNDVHRLTTGEGFPLGGVWIPCRFACVAVSDGDVLLHALVDALLGALGLGDIGDMYPESAVARGEDSRRFIRETVAILTARGASVVNADCSVHLEKPRLGEWKKIIGDTVAALLGVERTSVNIKAKTGEGMGPVGMGEAIAAEVAVLVRVPDGDGRIGS